MCCCRWCKYHQLVYDTIVVASVCFSLRNSTLVTFLLLKLWKDVYQQARKVWTILAHFMMINLKLKYFKLLPFQLNTQLQFWSKACFSLFSVFVFHYSRLCRKTDRSPAWAAWMDAQRTTHWQKVCVCVCPPSVCLCFCVEVIAACVFVCIWDCLLLFQRQPKVSLCVWGLFSLCVCVCACRCLFGFARSLDLFNP